MSSALGLGARPGSVPESPWAQIMREFAMHRENCFPLAYVYAIQAGKYGPVKIGIAKDPADRLLTLQQGSSEPLRGLAAWLGSPWEEKVWHLVFAEERIHGEWFKLTPDLVDTVWLRGGCDYEEWSSESLYELRERFGLVDWIYS